MEPKTPALGKNPETFFRKPPTLPLQKNPVKKWITNNLAPLIAVDVDGCNNSVSLGFKEVRAVA